MDEKNRALMEAHQIAATDEYFAARPQIDCIDRRRVFEAGFQRAWNAALSHRHPDGRLVQSEPFTATTSVPNGSGKPTAANEPNEGENT